MDKIKYLPHPCSKEDKRKANAEGYKVLDARFAPPEPKKAKPKKAVKKD
jgi:hypothetical protein